MQPDSQSNDLSLDEFQALQRKFARAQDAIGNVIFGQNLVIEQAFVTLLSGGHGLLVGVPGLAKTRLAESLGTVLGISEKRIQFTPDLMPADIIGSEILDQNAEGRHHFRFIKGPVFTQLLMADEINRASPRTQSALLQAMQENTISVAGENHPLPQPFHVFATQNPLEWEGTFPLPEAQLDRFLLQIDVGYPDRAAEQRMLVATTGVQDSKLQTVLSGEELLQAQRFVRAMPIGEQVTEAILTLVRAGRPDESELAAVQEQVAWGPGPRASQALSLTVRARAFLQGREGPSVDDVLALAPSILRHRMALRFAARAEGGGVDGVIDQLLDLVR